MRLILLTTLTMTAFAANSILNRMGVGSGGMDAVAFGGVRLLAGAVTLAILVLWRRRGLVFGGWRRLASAAALLTYIFGFSAAYLRLDAGLGALILFGTVQITMFAGGLSAREAVPLMRWLGAGLALVGLVWLLVPGLGGTLASNPTGGLEGLDEFAVGAIIAAGVGWGVYSLLGRLENDPLGATAMNFILAALVGLALMWGWTTSAVAASSAPHTMPHMIWLAVLSGSVTSGLGYALWYSILPALGATRAAVAQLSVPVIAIAGGMVFLQEPLTWHVALASVVILGGVALSLVTPKSETGG